MRCVLPLLVSTCLGCGLLAADGNEPGPLPAGGTGLFRPLADEETGLSGSPAGRGLRLSRGLPVGATSLVPSGLYYTSAPRDDDALPDQEPGDDVDWSLFGPTRILRAQPAEGAGYRTGPEVLVAEEAWEGEGVGDPWVLPQPDGRLRLYYAGEGGIGLAEAAGPEQAFVRLGDGPVIAEPGVRRPSVVEREDGGLRLYLEQAGGIAWADSRDGIDFGELTRLELPPAVDGPPEEVAVGAPAAVVAHSPVGRRFVRLYFESRRMDGQRRLHMAASEDGVSFERFERSVAEGEQLRFPSPLVLDSRVTVLGFVAPHEEGDAQVGAMILSVSPASVTLPQ